MWFGRKKRNEELPGGSSQYPLNASYKVLPVDLKGEVVACRLKVVAEEGEGAWFALEEAKAQFPAQEEIDLVEFINQEMLAHRARIMKRDKDRVWITNPSMTQREKSQLAPTSGRYYYRVQSELPVEVGLKDQAGEPYLCHLRDVSQGGMSLDAPQDQHYEAGSRCSLRVISWDYPVEIDVEVLRAWPEGETQRVALVFPDEMTVVQSELISLFIVDVQRREALATPLQAGTMLRLGQVE